MKDLDLYENEMKTSDETLFPETPKNKEPKKAKKEKKPWTRKKATCFWSLGITGSIALGVGIGYIFATLFNGGEMGDYSHVNVSAYAVNYDALIEKYNSFPKNADFSKSFTPCELANTSLTLLHRNERYMAQGYGKGTFNVFGVSGDQAIRSTMIRNGNDYFEESLSKSSLVQAAFRMYETYEGETSSTYRYKGSVDANIYDSHFSESAKETFTRDAYKETMGRYLDGIPCIYIISDRCLSKEGQKETSGIPTSVEKTDNGYRIELELNPGVTVKNYVLQMIQTGDLAGPPSFKYVHLTFELDSELNLISLRNRESYYAKTKKTGAGSNMKGDLTTYFYTKDVPDIPELSVQMNYDSAKEQ